MNARAEWFDLATGQFLQAWQQAHEHFTRDQAELVTGWIRDRLNGGDDFASETAICEVVPWGGEPALVLITDSRITSMRLDDHDLITEYMPAPSGGAYRETWRYVDDAFELELVYEHPSLPERFFFEFRTMREIERPAVEVLRSRFRTWAEMKSARD